MQLSREQLVSLPSATIRREMAQRSLEHFLVQSWPALEPGQDFVSGFHISLIAEYLQAVYEGQIRRLIINIPPRYTKSRLVTVAWPCWCWVHRPELRFMFTSYSADLSIFHSLERRTILRSDWYRRNWPGVQLSRDQDTKAEMANTQRGMMIATSVGGSATGKGGDVLIFDDPMNPQQAASDADRLSANTWIRRSFLTRLNDQKLGRVVGVMQRLHEQDTTGMLLELGGWEHLCIPGIAEGRTVYSFPISGRQAAREDGELICPEREGVEEIARRKVELGSYGFAGQYQQRPSPEEGGVLKRHWWRFWYPAAWGSPPAPVTCRLANGESWTCPQEPLPEHFDDYCHSWDMAFKETLTSDYVVGQAWARVGANKFLLDQLRKRADFPESVRMVKELVKLQPYNLILVEDKGNGAAVISTLKAALDIIGVNPLGGKEARINAVSATIEAGNVYLPHPSVAGWVSEFIERAAAFPNAAYDDECFVAGTMIATQFGDKPIEAVRIGDKVLTPFGLRKVLAAHSTGYKYVITDRGLTGTGNHPIYTQYGFTPLDSLTQALACETISLGGLIRWRYLKVLCSTILNIGSWEVGADMRETITLVPQGLIKSERVLKDFMWRCGSLVADRQYRKAMLFTTRMATASIMTLLTWSAYRVANTTNSTRLRIESGWMNIFGRCENLQRFGTGVTKARSGIKAIGRKAWASIFLSVNACVSAAKKCSQRKSLQSIVPSNADTNTGGILGITTQREPVSFAGDHLKHGRQQTLPEQQSPVIGTVERNSLLRIEQVFNLTVDDVHMYYANGILVSNCDSMSQALMRLKYYPPPEEVEHEETEEERWARIQRKLKRSTDTAKHTGWD